MIGLSNESGRSRVGRDNGCPGIGSNSKKKTAYSDAEIAQKLDLASRAVQQQWQSKSSDNHFCQISGIIKAAGRLMLMNGCR